MNFAKFLRKLLFKEYFGSTVSDCRYVTDALLGLRQFLATESPSKMMKNPFYFIFKALFVLKIFKFLF